jgi:hypothetical protein
MASRKRKERCMLSGKYCTGEIPVGMNTGTPKRWTLSWQSYDPAYYPVRVLFRGPHQSQVKHINILRTCEKELYVSQAGSGV